MVAGGAAVVGAPRRALRAGKRDEYDHYHPDEKMNLVCPHGEIVLSIPALYVLCYPRRQSYALENDQIVCEESAV